MPLNVKKTLLKAGNLAKKGDVAGAAGLYRSVLEQFPGNRQAAAGLAGLGARAAATPGTGDPAFHRGMRAVIQRFNSGDAAGALQQGQALARRFPTEPLVHNLVGAASTQLGRYEEGIAACSRAVALKPDYAEAYSNLGAAYNESGRQTDAIASYTRAIECDPSLSEAYNNLGNVFKDLGRYREALEQYREAIRLKPDFAMAYNNMATVQGVLGEYAASIDSCRQALRRQPGFSRARARLVHQLAQVCDWDALEKYRADIPALGLDGDGVVPFELLHLEDQPARHRQRSERFAAATFKAQPPRPAAAPEPPGQKPPRLRLGYFSADFHNHATMYLMARLFELHDRDRFEVHAFSYGPDRDDAMRHRLAAAVEHFHDIHSTGDREAAMLARQQPLDIAIDLKGYTQQSRLGIFAHRPAPIQVSWLGYPGTTGAPFIDYAIADDFVLPEARQADFSEQVIYLPHCYQVNDDQREIADNTPSRAQAGLPESGFVFCCFNNTCKIGPQEFDIWMRLLAQVDGSVLWLFASNPLAEDNLRAQALRRGIAPQRLVFAPRAAHAEHLARHRLADLFLDTFNYNAHTTASDALWAGLPLVTCAGQGFAARVAGSLLRACNLEDLVTHNAADYEQLALQLATDPARLAQFRGRLAASRASCPLFDTTTFTRDLERACEQALERHLAGQPPLSFRV